MNSMISEKEAANHVAQTKAESRGATEPRLQGIERLRALKAQAHISSDMAAGFWSALHLAQNWKASVANDEQLDPRSLILNGVSGSALLPGAAANSQVLFAWTTIAERDLLRSLATTEQQVARGELLASSGTKRRHQSVAGFLSAAIRRPEPEKPAAMPSQVADHPEAAKAWQQLNELIAWKEAAKSSRMDCSEQIPLESPHSSPMVMQATTLAQAAADGATILLIIPEDAAPGRSLEAEDWLPLFTAASPRGRWSIQSPGYNACELWILERRPERVQAMLRGVQHALPILLTESLEAIKQISGKLSANHMAQAVQSAVEGRKEFNLRDKRETSKLPSINRWGKARHGLVRRRAGDIQMSTSRKEGKQVSIEWQRLSASEVIEEHAAQFLERWATRALISSQAERDMQLALQEAWLQASPEGRIAKAIRGESDARGLHQVLQLQAERLNPKVLGPLESLDQMAAGQPITDSMISEAGMSTTAAEELLLARGDCYSKAGWVREAVYLDAFLTELLEELPKPETDAQQRAVIRQQKIVEELLEAELKEEFHPTPHDSYISPEIVQRYIVAIANERFTTTRLMNESELKLSVNEQGYQLFVNVKGELGKSLEALERYITRRNRMLLEDEFYHELDENFPSWLEREELMEEVAHARLKTIWGRPNWPKDPIAGSLPGWKRSRVPRPWQNSTTRRLQAQRGGIVAYKTGVGKTMAGIMGSLTQVAEGRRAIISVPRSVLAQWRDEIEMATRLPVAVIGATLNNKGGREEWEETKSSLEIDLQLHDAIQEDRRLLLVSDSVIDRIRMRSDTLWKLLKDEYEQLEMPHSGNDVLLKRAGMNMSFWRTYQRLVAELAIERKWTGAAGCPLAVEELERERDNLMYEIEVEKAKGLKNRGNINTTRIAHLQRQRAFDQMMIDGLNQIEKEDLTIRTTWEQLGIGSLFIDEVHNFKGTDVDGSSSVKYFGTLQHSARAQHMLMRCRHVQAKRGATVGLTATPYKNSLQDIYNEMHMLAPQIWRRLKINSPSKFVSLHADIRVEQRTRLFGADEFTEEVAVKVLQRLKNVRSLRSAIMPMMDVVTAADVGLKLPELRSRYEIYPTLPEAAQVIREVGSNPALALAKYADKGRIYDELQRRLAATARDVATGFLNQEAGAKTERELKLGAMAEALMDTMTLQIITQRAELDMEMIDPTRFKGHVSPKVSGLLTWVSRQIAHGTKILIYCDVVNMPGIGGMDNPNGYSFHEKLKALICRSTGLKPDEVGIINGQASESPEERHAIARAFNQGIIRTLIGNSKTMGEAINLQEEVGAVHHLDLPPNPAGIEQRQGRLVRQGNELEAVEEVFHMGSRGLDASMMDINRGKKGFYDQLWLGSEDVVDNPERSLIPSSERIKALAIDDDEERAARLEELQQRELKAQRAAKLRRFEQKVFRLHDIAAYQRAVEAEQEMLDRKSAHEGRKNPYKVHGSRALKVQRLLKEAGDIAARLKIQGFPQPERLTRLEVMGRSLYVPSLDRFIEEGESVHVKANTLKSANGIRLPEGFYQLSVGINPVFDTLNYRLERGGESHPIHMWNLAHGLEPMSIGDLAALGARAEEEVPFELWDEAAKDPSKASDEELQQSIKAWRKGICEQLLESEMDGQAIVIKDGKVHLVELAPAQRAELRRGRYVSEGTSKANGGEILAGPQARETLEAVKRLLKRRGASPSLMLRQQLLMRPEQEQSTDANPPS